MRTGRFETEGLIDVFWEHYFKHLLSFEGKKDEVPPGISDGTEEVHEGPS